MIIIAKKADFSAKNVGKITVNVDISAEVEAMSVAYGGLSTTKKVALQKFYDSLKTAGFWSRIKKIYAPFIANSIDKTFVDLKSLTTDWSPNTSLYTHSNLGIIPTAIGSSDTTGITVSWDTSNISFLIFSATSKTPTTSPISALSANSEIIFLNGSNSSLRVSFKKTGSSGSRINSSQSDYVLPAGKTFSNFGTLLGESCKLNEIPKTFAFGVQCSTSSTTVYSPVVAQTSYRPMRDYNSKTADYLETSLNIVMDSITLADYTTLLSYCNQLKSDLGL